MHTKRIIYVLFILYYTRFDRFYIRRYTVSWKNFPTFCFKKIHFIFRSFSKDKFSFFKYFQFLEILLFHLIFSLDKILYTQTCYIDKKKKIPKILFRIDFDFADKYIVVIKKIHKISLQNRYRSKYRQHLRALSYQVATRETFAIDCKHSEGKEVGSRWKNRLAILNRSS